MPAFAYRSSSAWRGRPASPSSPPPNSPYPLIADLTAPFVYARLMGTEQGEPLGYSTGVLDVWAERARTWAAGGMPEGLDRVEQAPRESGRRDVYLYVIGGDKVTNPRAAMALIERVG